MLFVGCFFRSKESKKYLISCQDSIEKIFTYFPNSQIEIHVDESIDYSDLIYFPNSVKIVKHVFPLKNYKFEMFSSAKMRKMNLDQLTKCVRLDRLFTFDSNKYDFCIVFDIHDDFDKSYKLIQKYLKFNQDYIFTKWKSYDSCPYDETLHKKNHYHFDAGLCIVKKQIRQLEIPFIDFCTARIFNSSSRLVTGVEEMLMDEYLKHLDLDIKWVLHKCEVNPIFYTNMEPIEYIGSVSDIVLHAPFSKDINELMIDNIYICSQ